MHNLFAQINQKGGSEITSNLKHLTPEEKQRRRAAAKALGGKVAGGAVVKSKFPSPTGPSKLLLEGNTWFIENLEGTHEMNECSMRNNLIISFCNNATIIVKQKCSAISMTNCKGINILFSGAVAGVDLTRCEDVKMQVLEGTCMNFTMDSVKVATYYLNNDSRNAQFNATAITSNNLVFPKHGVDDETVTRSIPEQFQHVIPEGTDDLSSRVSDLYLGDG